MQQTQEYERRSSIGSTPVVSLQCADNQAEASVPPAEQQQQQQPDSFSTVLQVLQHFDTEKLQRLQEKLPEEGSNERYAKLSKLLRSTCAAAAAEVQQRQQQQSGSYLPVLYLQSNDGVRVVDTGCWADRLLDLCQLTASTRSPHHATHQAIAALIFAVFL
jgi:hypothetical protein